MPQDITLTFLGHSAWRIQYQEFDILIDPFLTGNPLASVKAEDLNPTHIILSHGHGDHLGDTVSIAARSGAHVIVTFEVANYLKERHGVQNISDLASGGGKNFDFGRVKFTPAHHGSAAPDGTYLGTACGIILTMGGRKIYHSGDTALSMEMELLGRLNDFDVAMVPIGDTYTMDVDDAVEAIAMLKPKAAIPMHYNTFPPIEADAGDFRAKVEARGFKGVILNPGEAYQLTAE